MGREIHETRPGVGILFRCFALSGRISVQQTELLIEQIPDMRPPGSDRDLITTSFPFPFICASVDFALRFFFITSLFISAQSANFAFVDSVSARSSPSFLSAAFPWPRMRHALETPPSSPSLGGLGGAGMMTSLPFSEFRI
jgi:hypothetical protein